MEDHTEAHTETSTMVSAGEATEGIHVEEGAKMVENGGQVQAVSEAGFEEEDEHIATAWDFLRLHFMPSPEQVHFREKELLQYLTSHLPGFNTPHDISEVMSLADLPSVVNVPPPAEESEHSGSEGDPEIVRQVKHALVDMNGNVVKWFHHEREMTRHLLKKSQTFSYFAPHLKELSKIPDAPSIFLQRHAPYKDLIVPTGPNSSFLDSLINMVKSIIGAGLLSLPLAFSWAGWGLAVILMVMMSTFNAFTCDLLVKIGTHLKLTSYNELAEKAFGRWMSILVDVLTIVAGIGFLIASMVLLGDFGCALVDAASGPATCNRVLVVYVVSLITMFPLCLLRTLNSLRFLSFISLTFLTTFAIVVLVLSAQFIRDFGGVHPTVVAWSGSLNIFRAINVICFAFSCQYTVLPIFVELKRPSASNGYRFIDWAVSICFVMYLIVGLFGYFQFGNTVYGNVLLNYEQSTLMNVMIACFLFNVVIGYPLSNFAVRLSIDYLLFFQEYHQKRVNPNTQHNRMWLYTIILYVICASVGAFVTDVGLIFSITGSTATALLSLILPSSIFLKLRYSDIIKKESSLGINWFLLVTSGLVLLVGIMVLVVGTTMEILGILGRI